MMKIGAYFDGTVWRDRDALIFMSSWHLFFEKNFTGDTSGSDKYE